MTEAINLLTSFSDRHDKHMLGCYGNPVIKISCPGALVTDGACFDAAYADCPVYVSSRASMAIGDYGSRHGYWDDAYAYDGKVKSWGGRLTEQGFSVTTIGRLHFKGDMLETDFPNQRIPLHTKDGIGDVYGEIRDRQTTRPQFYEALEGARAGESDYTRYDRKVARQAAEFLKTEGSVSESPSALMTDFMISHSSLIVPQEHVDLHPDPEALPLPVQFDREEWPHRLVMDDYHRYYCQKGPSDSVKRNAIHIYYGLCSFLDAQMGVVPKALEEVGLNKNICVLYCTDHGDTMGERGLFFKLTIYEGGISIPMIFNGPGVRKGRRSAAGVSLVGIYPIVTKCPEDVTCEEDRGLPGRPLLAFVGGKEEPERAVHFEYLGFGVYTGELTLRRGRSKYAHCVEERPQLSGLKEDPEECRDLTGDPEYYEVIKRAEKELRTSVDPGKTKKDVRIAQRVLLDRFGGQEAFLKTFHPSLFLPTPDLEKKRIVPLSSPPIR